MRTSGRGLKNYLRSANVVQRLVLGWTVSPSYGLLKSDPSAYRKVAVDGVRLKEAMKDLKVSREVKGILKSLAEGGERVRTLESSLRLISQLMEVDLNVRERWVYASITASVSVAMIVAVMTALGKLTSFQAILIALLSLAIYPLIPSASPLAEVDPSIADSIASSLESGSGRVHALSHLGIYDELVVDHTLKEVDLPVWAEVLRDISGRVHLSQVMRRTASLLREVKRLEEYWRAKIRGLKATVVAMCGLLGVTNAFLMRSLSLLPISGFIWDLRQSMLILGLVYSLIASKPVRSELPSSMAYVVAFLMADYIIP